MEFKNFEFDPPGGFNDSNFYEDTPTDAREVLQRQHNQTRDYINSMVRALNSTKEGESGSEYIKSPAIDGVSGENVFSQIKDIKRQLVDASAGSINDGSIDSVKLASGCVTKEKIAAGNIESSHFSDEAECPFATETKNINGISASLYEPVATSGYFGFFKERVSDEKIRIAAGKTFGNDRIFADENAKIRKLSLKDFTLTDIVDFSGVANGRFVFAPDERGDLYIASTDISGDVYITFHKCEDNKLYRVSRFKLMPFNNSANYLCDVEIHDGYIYVFYLCSTPTSYYMIYIYKFPLENLENLSEATPFYSVHSDEYCSGYPLFSHNGDLYFGNYRMKNMSPDEVEKYPWLFRGYGDGKFFVSHDHYVLVDENMLPSMAMIKTANYYDLPLCSFIHKNYLYTVLTDYLFRVRIF